MGFRIDHASIDVGYIYIVTYKPGYCVKTNAKHLALDADINVNYGEGSVHPGCIDLAEWYFVFIYPEVLC